MDQRHRHGIGLSSRMYAVAMSYLRGVCGVSNENVQERCGMRIHANGVKLWSAWWNE